MQATETVYALPGDSGSIYGEGAGTLSIPSKLAEIIGPYGCDVCGASITFEASDGIKGTDGLVTIYFADQSFFAQGQVSTLKCHPDGNFLVMNGQYTVTIPRWDPNYNFVLTGLKDTDTGVWNFKLRDENGIRGAIYGRRNGLYNRSCLICDAPGSSHTPTPGISFSFFDPPRSMMLN